MHIQRVKEMEIETETENERMKRWGVMLCAA